jgi:hypothetical protein
LKIIERICERATAKKKPEENSYKHEKNKNKCVHIMIWAKMRKINVYDHIIWTLNVLCKDTFYLMY